MSPSPRDRERAQQLVSDWFTSNGFYRENVKDIKNSVHLDLAERIAQALADQRDLLGALLMLAHVGYRDVAYSQAIEHILGQITDADLAWARRLVQKA